MSFSSNQLKAYGCLALSMSLVGAYVALTKPLALVLPVFLLGWMRFGIGAVAMLRWTRKPATEPVLSVQTRWLIFLESFLGNFLFTLCMIVGVSMTSAVSAGVIMSCIPATVAVLSRVFLKEAISVRVWAAIACGVLGIGLLSLTQASAASAVNIPDGQHGRQWLGNLLIFGAVLCEGSYAVIGKKLTAVLSPKRISAVINLWGFVLMTPMGLYTALQFDFTSVELNMWVLLLFYGLAASVWTVWLWMVGLKSVPASQAGVFTVMLPISAALVGVMVLGEHLGGVQLLAFAIALAGLLLATLPSRS
ncbi:DMT family transporter [Pollutimonas harenae]|uniref:DMT family transporter n=1 Tax=Pollutimonas harenae TaxID=657015 RepID=A0A853H2Z0_9BURK|nr:DMT family transporter [Pollutimonas harenae]NYT86199.1 DMT family transporter [Pollutimonas harenae]TEA71231.1 DMT family transporter [Pollutimonas harenae]